MPVLQGVPAQASSALHSQLGQEALALLRAHGLAPMDTAISASASFPSIPMTPVRSQFATVLWFSTECASLTISHVGGNDSCPI